MSNAPMTSYERDNAKTYRIAFDAAAAKSATPEYRGCALHLCAVVRMVNCVPLITGYRTSDWTDDSTVATFVNGDHRS